MQDSGDENSLPEESKSPEPEEQSPSVNETAQ